MKRLSAFTAFFLLLSSLSFAQRPGGGGGGGRVGSSNPGLTPRQPMTLPEIERPVFVSGKVVLADGSPISEPAAVASFCNNRRRIETYTDSHGSFSFELKKKSSSMATQSADMSTFGDDRGSNALQWRGCELLAVLPGFTSDTVQLVISASVLETTDVGRITLRPIGNAQGSVLSATSLAAPGDAKKAAEKAHEQEKKNKLEDARKSLQKAVTIYPQYAAAWTDLGRLQHMNHEEEAAKHSYEQAIAADDKYARPYLGLAQLALDSHQWQPLIDVTGKVLALDSVSFPQAWFLNSVAHFNLGDIAAAEASARDGLKVDSDHHVPRMEYLMGVILYRKGDFAQAAQHVRHYIEMSSEPAQIAEAQKQLAEIEQSSASAGVTKPPQK